MRRIVAERAVLHVDIASQIGLAALVSAVVPVVYMDYRPLAARLSGFAAVATNAVELPLADGSVRSLSCLHVAEHVGLGRYGDPLDPEGTRRAAAELIRVLAPGASLFFGVPVGRERVSFNAHRIHAVASILRYFAALELVEFSGVDDSGRFHDARLDAFDRSRYGSGMFWFRRPA